MKNIEMLFFLILKETSWERFRYALQLCYLDSPVIHGSLPWFGFQRMLKLLHILVNPLHKILVKILPNQNLKDKARKWLAHS